MRWPTTSCTQRYNCRDWRGGNLWWVLICLTVWTQAWSATTERPEAAFRKHLRTVIAGADSFSDRFEAEVWLVDMSGRLERTLPGPNERITLLKLVHQEAKRAALNPELVLAVIQVESNFDRYALSVAGARGLMQIMPFWVDEIGSADDNLFHVDTNLRYGCTILRHYIDRERGNLVRALARYNGSLGQTWYPDRVFKSLRTRWYKQ